MERRRLDLVHTLCLEGSAPAFLRIPMDGPPEQVVVDPRTNLLAEGTLRER